MHLPEDDRPSEVALTDYVESYLQDRAFATVKDSISSKTCLKGIKIATTLVPVSISKRVVADRVERRLKNS